MPISRRCGGSRDSGLPSSRISPSVGVSKPASIISVVVLPEPRRPEQRQELAALDVEVQVFDDQRFAVIGLADIDELHVGRGHSRDRVRPGARWGG